MSVQDYGITPAQYHAGLDKLWKALGVDGVQDDDVFTLCAKVITELKEELEVALADVARLCDKGQHHGGG